MKQEEIEKRADEAAEAYARRVAGQETTDTDSEDFTIFCRVRFDAKMHFHFGYLAAATTAQAEIERLEAALREAKAQIEYLQGKFQETGSGNSVLARIDAILSPNT